MFSLPLILFFPIQKQQGNYDKKPQRIVHQPEEGKIQLCHAWER